MPARVSTGPYNQNSRSAGPQGPLLMDDELLAVEDGVPDADVVADPRE